MVAVMLHAVLFFQVFAECGKYYYISYHLKGTSFSRSSCNRSNKSWKPLTLILFGRAKKTTPVSHPCNLEMNFSRKIKYSEGPSPLPCMI